MSSEPIESIRVIPQPEGGRVESGPVQFGDDWPGVFFRGDQAFFLASCLDLEQDDSINAMFRPAVLEGLIADLRSCILSPPEITQPVRTAPTVQELQQLSYERSTKPIDTEFALAVAVEQRELGGPHILLWTLNGKVDISCEDFAIRRWTLTVGGSSGYTINNPTEGQFWLACRLAGATPRQPHQTMSTRCYCGVADAPVLEHGDKCYKKHTFFGAPEAWGAGQPHQVKTTPEGQTFRWDESPGTWRPIDVVATN